MEVTQEYIKYLIGDKKPKIAEIELTLFENCDVVCAFCGHEKNSTTGMLESEIKDKIQPIESFLKTIDDDVNVVHLHLVGGELLQNRLINQGYLSYYESLIDAYLNLCSQLGFNGKIILVTNLLFTQREQLKSWLEGLSARCSISLIASYDPHGRPITKDYLRNIEYFKPFISNINMVLTKHTIAALKTPSTFFNYLYEEFEIFVDDFLPDKETEGMIPSSSDFMTYLNLVKNNYPKLLPYGPFIQGAYRGRVNELQFTTFNKCTILPNGSVTNYLWPRHEQEYFKTKVNYNDNSNMLFNFLDENQCLTCSYFQECPLKCPVSWSWNKNEDNMKAECEIRSFLTKSL